MAVDHWWLGTTSTDHANAANWSTAGSGGAPGASVPGTGDEVLFDGNGNNPCTLTANLALLHLDVLVGYASKIDLDTFNLTMDDGGNITLDGGDEFDAGTGTISLTNGDFDNRHQATYTRGTSELIMNGVGNLIGNTANDLHDLTIAAGATITVSFNLDTQGTVTVDGTLSVSDIRTFFSKGLSTTTIGASGKITGDGIYLVDIPAAGEGITSFAAGGVVDIAELQIHRPMPAAILAPGTYQATLVIVHNDVASASTLTLSAGSYVFTGDFEMENTNAGGSLTIANNTNDPDITCQGDVIHTETAGTITYTKGTGAMVLSGTADQNINFGGHEGEDIEIDKPVSGDVTLTDCDCQLTDIDMAGDLTVTGSTLTADASDKDVDGDVDWSDAGNDISCGTGTTWTFGGDFDFSAIGTITRETAEFVLTGSGPNILAGSGGAVGDSLNGLTFDTNANYNITETLRVNAGTLLLATGATVDIATSKKLIASAGGLTMQVQSGATISATGSGLFELWGNITQQDGEISAPCDMLVTASVVGGNYSGLLRLRNTAASNRTQTLAGAFTVGNLEFEATSTGNFTIDAAGLTAMTVSGDITIDLDSSGDITVDSTGSSADWDIAGDVIDEHTGGGTFLWTVGDTTLTASGGSAQNWDWMGHTVGAITVDKSGGTLTFSGAVTTASFTGTAGTFDPNGKTITVAGNCFWGSAFSFTAAADTFNGCKWDIAGNFTANGQTLNATAAWELEVDGTARANGTGAVAYSEADGFTEVSAPNWTDNGNTLNWDFTGGGRAAESMYFRHRSDPMTAYPN